MKTEDYHVIETYMLECMQDSAHDREHIYRVLYVALDIAEYEEDVDYDVLIAACLLHDIGRKEQYENPELCHAAVGPEKAYKFLIENNFRPEYAEKVAVCIKSHRFRSEDRLAGIEEKILFDADKIDVAGALGITRTIFYQGQVGEPLYSVNEAGEISDGSRDTKPSFFQEYKFKLEGLYAKFYTERGKEIAGRRQHSAVSFYESMKKEAGEFYQPGRRTLSGKLE